MSLTFRGLELLLLLGLLLLLLLWLLLRCLRSSLIKRMKKLESTTKLLPCNLLKFQSFSKHLKLYAKISFPCISKIIYAILNMCGIITIQYMTKGITWQNVNLKIQQNGKNQFKNLYKNIS